MKALILTIAALFSFTTLATAQSLSEFRWKSRPVLMFTPSPDDPNFQRQVALFADAAEELAEREIKVIFITPDGKFENTGRFLDEATSRRYYEMFSVAQYQFEMVLVGYDGYEKFRAKNRVTPPSIITNLIDGMPMRKRELLQGYNNESTVGDTDSRVVNKRRRF